VLRLELLLLTVPKTSRLPIPEIKIRALTTKDLPAVRKLWTQTKGIEMAEGDSLPSLKRFLRRNRGASHLAVGNGKVVGALLAGHDGRRGFLYHLAVDPACRRAGIGRKLVDSSLAALKAKGIVRVLLLVARDNRKGIRFWMKQGWEPLVFANPMGKNP
jgi:N-acetylglutamate synthase